MTTENQHQETAPPPAGFLMTPEQHRRRALEMKEAGRPDLARHHDNCALIIERRRRQMH
jgi:hypothetical protein